MSRGAPNGNVTPLTPTPVKACGFTLRDICGGDSGGPEDTPQPYPFPSASLFGLRRIS